MPSDRHNGSAFVPTPHTLEELRNRQLRRLRELRYFRLKNHLERSATYPRDLLWHYSVVVLIVVLESTANMYFFAQGSSLGLLGGLLQAMLVSVVNVGTAVVVGKFYVPELHHIQASRRGLGVVVIASHALFVAWFNLVVAHYRDLLASRPETALRLAIPETISQPFGLSFDSLMLLVAGVVAAGLGLWKGQASDDAYPGYGPLDRRYEEAKAEFVVARQASPSLPYPHPDAGEDS